ncbi:carboxypeptidase-like regulatory domain-containing protein [Niabella sp. 22666]|uniref:carboxypeptidase-like regulatory domain-containing protein n=1 Tax=Niabella sp. 22666 TaxID=3453954 RepID=UPI003F84958C
MQQINSTYPFYGPEDIKRYLSGSMSAQEMHDMEKAALKDPLLADAIDGFRNADPVVTDTHLNALKASILGLSQQEQPEVIPLKPSSKPHWWRWVAAACSLTLIAGTTWWMMQKATPPAPPIAQIEQTQPADTSRNTLPPPSSNAVTPMADQAQVVTAKTNESTHAEPGLKKEPIMPAKVAVPALAEASDPVQPFDYEAIQPKKELLHSESRALKQERISFGNASAMAAPAPSAADMAKNMNTQAANKAMGFQPVAYIEGLVVDKEGTPLANASIAIPGRNKTTANNDGSFVLPVYDSSFGVSVNMVGYRNATAYLKPGKQNKVILEKAFNSLDETVVVGNGVKRKKTFAYMEDARKAQAAAVSANEVIYPEEGWSHFYEELGTSLGVNKAQKTKTLQIKFTVDDNGDPVDFEVVESPDAIMAKKAIEFIKKAKWKNFKLDKNALVKIEVN